MHTRGTGNVLAGAHSGAGRFCYGALAVCTEMLAGAAGGTSRSTRVAGRCMWWTWLVCQGTLAGEPRGASRSALGHR